MAGTPEGKVKAMVKKVLDDFGEDIAVTYNGHVFFVKTLKQFWPVPSGYGASDLDIIVCYYGEYIAIEVKAPGKQPKPRQQLTLAETIGAGGHTFVIDGLEGINDLCELLHNIKVANANDSKREA